MDAQTTRTTIACVGWALGARDAVRESLAALDAVGASAPRLELEHDGVPVVVSLGPTMSRVEVTSEDDTPVLELRVPTGWLTGTPA